VWDWGVGAGTEDREVLWEGCGDEDVDGWRWERDGDEGEGLAWGCFEG
jgi:hypothetical protein